MRSIESFRYRHLGLLPSQSPTVSEALNSSVYGNRSAKRDSKVFGCASLGYEHPFIHVRNGESWAVKHTTDSSKPIGEPRSKPAVLFFSHPARRAIWVLDACLDIDSSIFVVCQSLHEDLLSMVVGEIELRVLDIRVHTAT